AAWIGQRKRSEQEAESETNGKQHQYTDKKIEAILREIDGYSDYGFQEGVVKQVKEGLLKPQIRAKLERGEELSEIPEKFFYDFGVWLEAVMGINYKDWLESVTVTKKEGEQSKRRLEDMYLYYLVNLNGSLFSNTTAPLINYLFYKSKEMLREKPEQIGPFTWQEFERWGKIIRRHDGKDTPDAAKKIILNTGMKERIIQSDVEDYFRSRQFINWYDNQGGRQEIDAYLNSPNRRNELLNDFLQKTYSDVSGGRFGWKGWLIMFRNMFRTFLPLIAVTLLSSIAVPLFIPSVSFILWGVIVLGSLGVVFLAYKGADLMVNKILSSKYVGRWDPVDPETGYKAPTGTSTRKWHSRIMMGAVLIQKLLWNFYICKMIAIPLFTILYSNYFFVGGNILLLVGAAVPFLLFFLLDIFAFFYLTEATVGYALGKYYGVNRINKWKHGRIGRFINKILPVSNINTGKLEAIGGDSVVDKFEDAGREFQRKILPSTITGANGQQRPITQDEMNIAWAKAWNMIIDRYYLEDRISEAERDRYKYVIEENPNNFFGGIITKDADLSKAPRNDRIRRRLYHFLSTLFMDMERMPIWEQLYLFSVMTPCYEEILMYLFSDESIPDDFEAINEKYLTGERLLTYVISRYPDEWENFVRRMAKDGKYSPEDINRMRELCL
ncbi:MAG: hypothetical protein KJ838_03920, partial [Candidatus Omnitrophica bacterium]|nr:hypothetical protein [Candidatus Omnitrophota bacterium]